MPKRIALFGGTFDPIHIGHLILGESAWEQFALEKVLFMPSGNPPAYRSERQKASAYCHITCECFPQKLRRGCKIFVRGSL